MRRALLLNATYEPLCVVPVRRAVVLVLDEKAELIHDSGDALHSERMTIPVPSVIRLRYYVKLPYLRRAALSRRAVFARDGSRCQYCSAPAESIDHVVPRSRGGAHDWDNVVAACRHCNTAKKDRFLSETTLVLRHRPIAPKGPTWVAVAMGSVPTLWEPYLEAALTG